MPASVTLAELDTVPNRFLTESQKGKDFVFTIDLIAKITSILQSKGVEFRLGAIEKIAQAFFDPTVCRIYPNHVENVFSYINSLNNNELFNFFYFLTEDEF